MSKLLEPFMRASRFLKIDGDEYFTSSALNFFKRPEIMAAFAYATIAVTIAPDDIPKDAMAIVFASGALMNSALINRNRREKTRMEFKYAGIISHKFIDTSPQARISYSTSDEDMRSAQHALQQAKPRMYLSGAVSATSLTFIPFTHQALPHAAAGAIASYFGYQAYRKLTMQRIVERNWVVRRGTPMERDEFETHEYRMR